MFEIQETRIKKLQLEAGEQIELPTIYGHFKLIPFLEKAIGKEHIALIKGIPENVGDVLTRIHSACATGDLFGSLRCDCGEQLHLSMKLIEQESTGIIIYLQQEGRGIGLMNKIKTYKLQENGLDTVDANLHLGFKADERDYQAGAQILKTLKVSKIRLLTNNPEKKEGLETYGIEVACCVPICIEPNQFNAFYLKTKEKRMGHIPGKPNMTEHV